MASRPSLQLFPPTEKKLHRKDSRRSAAHPPPKISLDRSKSPSDFHELIIQVPASSQEAPPQLRYLPPEQPTPAHLESERRRNISPTRDPHPQFTTSPSEAGSSASPSSGYPARTASIASRVGPRKRTPTPKFDRREDSAFGSPYTVESQSGATFQSPQREKRSFSPVYADDKRAISPASGFSASPTLVRTMSGRTATRSPVSPEEFIPMQSIFPQYNPQVPLAAQEYRPTRDIAPAEIPKEQISRAPYSPPPGAHIRGPHFITPASELHRLWDASNGQVASPGGPTNFSLQMNRPSETVASSKSAKERPQITFGPSPKKPFYSLRQSDLEPEIVSDPAGNQHQLLEHELLVFRHHPNRPDVLPIAHMDVSPPPPPSLSTTRSIPVASSSGFPMDVEAGAADADHLPHHITTISPTIATLTALSATANSPAASAIALSDPNANSPQARKLAENAVRAAEEQESVEVLWRRTSPSSGVYELLHPAIGVIQVSVQGNITGKLDNPPPAGSNLAAKISLLNPYPTPKDEKYHKYNPQLEQENDDSVLASLDLASGVLEVNTAAINTLRNPYLADVSVCAILAVAVAESRRADDPGLRFEAPPSPKIKTKAKGTTKPKPERKLKKQQQQNQNRDPENEFEELPKATRGVLAILRFMFKSVIWLLTLGVKMLVGIVKGISRCFK